MKEIPLTKGFKAIVDDEDYEYLMQWKWHYSNGYALRDIKRIGERRSVRMHREIVKTPEHLITDHINGNKLDNRRSNLRVCTDSQNNANSSLRSDSKSGFKGVSWHDGEGKWMVRIQFERRAIFVGYFSDKIAAAHAYDEAARKYHGKYARTNF